MTPAQFQRLEELFHQANDLPSGARRAFVESQCGDDSELKAELDRLLQTQQTLPLAGQLHADIQRQLHEAIATPGHEIGQRVGQFEITGLLGRGGMGIVYRARDSRLGREVAIKALPPALTQNAAQLARLEREARILASLSHPNIATLYGLEESGPCPLLVMELLDGETLAQRLARQRLSIEEALGICSMIAAGVAAAHEEGVIHRDLKPGNICLTKDGHVKVLDFGLAREMLNGQAANDSREMPTAHEIMTLKGVILGTPGYMSPEQARGEPIGKRSDVFAFGCILYECLAGRLAFAGPTPADAIATVLHREPDSAALPANIPVSIRRLLARCLAKDPRQRVRDMGDVCLELRQALESREWTAPAAESQRTRKPVIGRFLPWLLAAAATAWGASLWLKPDHAALRAPSLKRFSIPFPRNLVQKELMYVRLALSRDGHHLLFTASDDKTQDVWLRSDDALEHRRMTEGLDALGPFFSPDAQWMAFMREGSLMKRRLSGGNAVKIGNCFTWLGASWGSDGSIILPVEWAQSISRYPAGGGPPHRITTLDPKKNDVAHMFPRYLPGERAIVFSVWNGKDPESSVECVTLSTGERKRLVDKGGTPHFARTPLGNYLLWDRAGTIYAAPFDPDRLELAGPERAIVDGVLTSAEVFSACFDVADDGTLAYVPGPVFFEENRLTWLAKEKDPLPFNDDKSSFGDPQFSHDGKKLSVLIKGTIYTPYIYDLDRGTFTRVLCDGDVETVSISPTGEEIAFSSHRNGGYGIYIRRLKDGQETQVMTPAENCPWQLQWSADSKFLTFALMPPDATARDIWIADVGSKQPPRRLVATEADERYPSLSPDGQWLAYVVSTETGIRQVYIQSFPDGTRRRQISSAGGDSPHWAEVPGKLYYRTKDGLQMVEISSADGAPAGPPALIYPHRFGQCDPDLRDYTIAPDGRILIIEHTDRVGVATQINLILNWHELLKSDSRESS